MPRPPQASTQITPQERSAESWRRFRDGEQLRPPALVSDLRTFLAAKFPQARAYVIDSAAASIDAAARALARSRRVAEVRISGGRAGPRSRTVAADLRRLERAAKARSPRTWCKAWTEASADTMCLLRAAAGGTDEFYALLVETVRAPGLLPVPAPRAVEHLLPAAKRLARETRVRDAGWRDALAVEAGVQLERLVGVRLKTPTYDFSAGHFREEFVNFLDAIEQFYAPHYFLRLGLRNSGRALTQVVTLVRMATAE